VFRLFLETYERSLHGYFFVILSPPKAGEESLFKRDSSLGSTSFRMTDGKKRGLCRGLYEIPGQARDGKVCGKAQKYNLKNIAIPALSRDL